MVDAGQVQYIVQQVLGDVLTVSEVRTLVQKGEAVGAASTCSNLLSSTLIYTHLHSSSTLIYTDLLSDIIRDLLKLNSVP